jgi:REP element-mobilizing transposase RayT
MKRIQRYDQVAIYHCLSRVVHGERLLDERGKAVFCKILRRVAGFCGVRVLTYCVMSNHFHLLVEVPSRALCEQLTDAELVQRFRLLYGQEGNCYMPITADDLESVLAAGGAVARGWRERLHSRMNDLPMFMKLLKQRFTRWYNKTHETYGTFWSERYASLLVEPEPEVLRKVACYIDLNPVRAGLVEDPARYAWSGFGAASMGDGEQRDSLIYLAVYGHVAGDDDFNYYVAELYQRGAFSMEIPGKEGFIPSEVVERVLRKGIASEQPKPFAKEFSDWLSKGFALGSKRFLESQIPWVSQLLGWKSRASIQQGTSTQAVLNRRLN